MLADVVDRADVRMVQGRGGTSLAAEALESLTVAGQAGRQKLEGDAPAQTRVLRAIDDTHAASAELVDDTVVGDGFTDHVGKLDLPDGRSTLSVVP